MKLFEFVFYKKNGQGLVNADEVIAAIDQKSIIFDTSLNYGERSLKINVLADKRQTQPFYNFFKQSVYKVELKLKGDIVWVGKLDQGSPTLSNYDGGPLAVSFSGFFILLNRLVDKLWIDTQTVGNLFQSREPTLNKTFQLDGSLVKDANTAELRMLHKDETLVMGIDRYWTEYEFNGGYSIAAIEGVTKYRSGQGVRLKVLNVADGTIVLQVDLSDTGDQTTLKTFNVPFTAVGGSNTDKLYYIMGTSTAAPEVFNYGSGTLQLASEFNTGEDALVLAFQKNFTKLISQVSLDMSLSNDVNPLTFVAAIYDNNFNYIDKFDNSVTVLGTAIQNVVFTKSGGLNAGAATGADLAYYLVLRSDQVGQSSSPWPLVATYGTGSASNPPTGYVTNGYKQHSTLGGVYPNFPASLTTSTPSINDWTTMSFELVLQNQLELDQNDVLTIEDFKTYAKAHPSHPNDSTPYGVKWLLTDMVLETLPEFDPDFSTIASDIFNGDPVDYSGVTSFESIQASDLIKKLLLLSQSEYYYTVYSHNNGGVPRLNVVKRVIPTAADYIVSTKDHNVKVEINSVADIRNYILITYTDANGLRRRLSPKKYPQLTDSASVALYDRQDYEVDLGSISQAEALLIGEGILANYAYPRPSGTITVTGYIKSAVQTHSYHVSKVKAGETIQVFNFTDPNKQINPIYIIGSAAYTSGNDELIIRLDEVDQNEAFFKNIRKPSNKFS